MITRKTILMHITTVPGTLWFLEGQPAYMSERGFEVHAISSHGQSLQKFADEQGVQVHAVEMSRRITPLKDLISLWRIWRVLRFVKPQIVHAHTPKAGLLGMLAALLAGVPVRIYHIHGSPAMTAGRLKKLILMYAEKISCLCACRVFCVSNSLRDFVVKEGLCSSDKISVLCNGSANGVDTYVSYNHERLVEAEISEIRKSIGLPPDARAIGFVGRIVRDKGVAELVEAWKSIRGDFSNVHLVIAGETESHDPVPVELMETLRSDVRVHMIGKVDRKLMPAVYSLLSVLVLPTHREGFSNVTIEAAAMGVPVVSTAVTGVVDAVVDGVTGTLVPVRNASALADALRRYLLDEKLRLRHGQAGRKRVMRDFRPEFIHSALFDEYISLIDHSRLRAEHCLWRVFYQTSKRFFDVVASFLLGIVFLPLMLLIAIAIRITMGTPIFYKEERPGRNERTFTIWKFRSMTYARDGSGRLLPDSARLTRLGRFLRKTSLDELPQLWNVLKGEMSFVGPRPLKMDYLPFYTRRERCRHEVRPGITGLAQISGRNLLGWDERLEMDVVYVEKQGFLMDIRILLLTVVKCIAKTGVAEVPGEVLPPLDLARGSAQERRCAGGSF